MLMFPAYELTLFLGTIGFMLLLARLIFKTIKFSGAPALIAELLTGILLGPTLLGKVFPELYKMLFPTTGILFDTYTGLFNISLVLLLFCAGMSLDFSLVIKKKKTIFFICLLGILLPFVTGFLAGWLYPGFFNGQQIILSNTIIFPLILGTALSISSLPIIARILLDHEVLATTIGTTIIFSALITDIIGWLIFSIIFAISFSSSNLFYTIPLTILFFLAMLTFAPILITKIITHKSYRNEPSYFDIGMLLGICFLSAAFTELIHSHASIGAFIAGIACGKAIGNDTKIIADIRLFVMNFFAPIFFISIGLHIDLIDNLNLPLIIVIITLAYLSKWLSAGMGAYLSGIDLRSSLIIGISLNARGMMEIIFGSLALNAGFISEQLFVALIIMALATTLTSSSLLTKLLRHHPLK